MQKSATLSNCEKYRYELRRTWGPLSAVLPIIMLNPSTADDTLDDPTIRRCVRFAQDSKYGGISVFNLFSFRATSPDEMKKEPDPIGPYNDHILIEVLSIAAEQRQPVLCAWGSHGDFKGRSQTFMGWARILGTPTICLGMTKSGQPRHPLYVPASQPFEAFNPLASHITDAKPRSPR